MKQNTDNLVALHPSDNRATPTDLNTRSLSKLLASNTALSLLGKLLPMIVAVIAIPILLKTLGTQRFSLLTLAWAIVGYFSIVDLGMGRALTKLTAEKLGSRRNSEVRQLAYTGICLMGILGCVGGAALALSSVLLANSAAGLTDSLRSEVEVSVRIMALTIPLIIVTSGVRGMLEAYQKFSVIAGTQVLTGTAMFVFPMIAVRYSHSLPCIAYSLLIVRCMGLASYMVFGWFALPDLRGIPRFCTNEVGRLYRFGGWITVSNIVGPILLYADRFFIASSSSVEAVAYYTTPYEVIARMLIIPGAITTVVFPALSSMYARDKLAAHQLYQRTCRSTMLVIVPMCVVGFAIVPTVIGLWIGTEFEDRCQVVARLLIVGIAVNSFALVTQAYLQAAGRPDLTAKLQIAELPLYLIYLPLCLAGWGINGAALASLIRVSFSALALAYLVKLVLVKHTTNCTEPVQIQDLIYSGRDAA